MSTFTDTSAFLAVLDEHDAAHHAASAEWARLLAEETELVTTNYVVLETCAVAQRELGLEAVRTLWLDVLPAVTVHWVDDSVHGAAMTSLLAAGRRRLSLVDYTSFEVMRRLGIHQAFVFDPHFAEQGFTCIPH